MIRKQIDIIKKAESDALKIVKDAEKEAKWIIDKAEKKANKKREKILQELHEKHEKIKKAKEKELRIKAETLIQNAKKESQRLKDSVAMKYPQAIDYIVKKILTEGD